MQFPAATRWLEPMIGKPRVGSRGPGALGLATALALADAGCRVTIYDPADPGANASGVAAGMLAPAFESILDPASDGHFPLLLARSGPVAGAGRPRGGRA